MSNTTEQAHANPAKPDEPPFARAVVLTKARTVRQGRASFPWPVGAVIQITSPLPPSTTFTPPWDCKLIPAGELKVGDIAPD
jgi:hypothetical protein